jgi:probable HAF family extracellular repeat protein
MEPVLLAVVTSSLLAAGSFETIGEPADGVVVRDISADGSVAVGERNPDPGPPFDAQVFRWTRPGGLELVCAGIGEAVSADGGFIVGRTESTPSQGIIWDGATQTLLYPLDGVSGNVQAFDVSADGAVVVGASSSASGFQAFRWSDGEMSGLGYLSGISSEAHAVSADGNVIAGFATVSSGPGNFQGFRWTAESGMVPLELPPGAVDCHPLDISDDGSVIVGRALMSGGGFRGFRWTVAGGADLLPLGIEYPNGVSGDGRVVVGSSGVGLGAVAWIEGVGLRSVLEILTTDCGLDLDGWALQVAYSVSADGTIVAGAGTNPSGEAQSWICSIDCGVIPPAPCSGDVDGDGDVDVFDFSTLAANFGRNDIPPGSTLGDLDGDGDVDVFDFAELTAGFGCVRESPILSGPP